MSPRPKPAAAETCPFAPHPQLHGVLEAPLPSAVHAAVLRGDTAYVGHDDGWVEQWNIKSGKLIGHLRASYFAVRSLAVDPDGVVTVVTGESVARRWRIDQRALVGSLEVDGDRIVRAASSAKRDVLVLATRRGRLRVWRNGHADRRDIRLGHAVSALAVSMDGRWIAAGDGACGVDVIGPVRRRFAMRGSSVTTLQFAASGHRLFAAALDQSVAYYDPDRGRVVKRVPGCAWWGGAHTLSGQPAPCPEPPDPMASTDPFTAFSPHGHYVLLDAGSERRRPEAPADGGGWGWGGNDFGVTTRFAVDPLTDRALDCGSMGVCRVLETKKAKLEREIGDTGLLIGDFDVDPESHAGTLTTWEGTIVWTAKCGFATTTGFVPEQTAGVAYGKGYRARSILGKTRPELVVTRLADGTRRSFPLGLGPVAAARNAPIFALGGSRGRFAIIDARRGRVRKVDAHWCDHDCDDEPGAVHDLALSADGRLLVLGLHRRVEGWDEQEPDWSGLAFGVWSLPAGRRLWVRSAHEVNAVALSPDAKRVAAASVDGQVGIYDAQSGEQVWDIRQDHSVTAVAFAGVLVVTGDEQGVVRVWDPPSDTAWKLGRHAGRVSRLRALPNGLALSSSVDGTLMIWDVRGRSRAGVLAFHRHGWLLEAHDGTVEASVGATDAFEYRPAGVDGLHLPGGSHYADFATPGLLGRVLANAEP